MRVTTAKKRRHPGAGHFLPNRASANYQFCAQFKPTDFCGLHGLSASKPWATFC